MQRVIPKPSPLGGMGLYAPNHSFSTGEKILSEAPILTLPAVKRENQSAAIDALFQDIQTLDKGNLAFVRHLLIRHKPDVKSMSIDEFVATVKQPSQEMAEGIVELFFASCHPYVSRLDASEFQLFKTLSLINHACAPNAELSWDRETDKMVLRATKPISNEEEIIISYIDPFQTQSKRHADLGFVCKCPTCTDSSDIWEKVMALWVEQLRMVDAFWEQYLNWSKNDMDIAPEGLARAVAVDNKLAEVKSAAQEFIVAVENVQKATGGVWACERIAQVYQLLYIIQAALAVNVSDRVNCIDADSSAFDYKLRELRLLGTGLGLKHPKTTSVMHQLFDLAEVSRSKTQRLGIVLEALGARLQMVEGADGRYTLGAQLKVDA